MSTSLQYLRKIVGVLTQTPSPNGQYIPRNMHTVFALLCFVVVIHWLIFPYPSGLLLWHCGNLTIAPVPAKQPWWIWINTSCEFIMNDCITTTKQSTTKPCAYFLGYTVYANLTFGYDWRILMSHICWLQLRGAVITAKYEGSCIRYELYCSHDNYIESRWKPVKRHLFYISYNLIWTLI